MKDVYKIKAGDTMESIKQRVTIVHEMVNGKRPADTRQADIYLQEIKKGLATLQEIIDIS